MNVRTVLVASVLLMGCPAPEAAAPRVRNTVNITNQHGWRGLLASLGQVRRVELVRSAPRASVEALLPEDQARLLRLIRAGALTDSRTLTSAPWPAMFLFHTRNQGSYAVTLVGHSTLRLHPGGLERRLGRDTADSSQTPPPEMVLKDDDGWLWRFLESRLGHTQEKEYLAPKRAPDYLELPERP